MPKTIQQTVIFNVSPKTLFETYIDSKKHSTAINSKVSISRRIGEKFSAYDGYIKGKNLFIVPNRLIIQSWRGLDWKKNHLDSTLILTFSKISGGGKIDMVHANVPDNLYNAIKKGWNEYYWQPWKRHFKLTKRS
jgi:activator of HSP90 ATPase